MAFHTAPIELLTKEEILSAHDIEEVDVPVPQWGRTAEGHPKGVRIRTFTKRQVSAMMKRATTRDRITGKDVVDNDMLEALMFTEGVISPQFTLDDYETLQEKSAVTIALIMKAINDASGLSDLAVQEATKSAPSESNLTIRVSPGARVGHDTNGTAGENVRG